MTLLVGNAVLVAITFFTLVIVGVAVALGTGNWWAVVAAAAPHAVGTFAALPGASRGTPCVRTRDDR